MVRNFRCPETEAPCIESRCKKGTICFEQERQLAGDSLQSAAQKDIAVRQWQSRQDFLLMEWSDRLRKSAGSWVKWAQKKHPKNSD